MSDILEAEAPAGFATIIRPLDRSEEFVKEEGDHEKYAHYWNKDELMVAMIQGIPIRALCGFVKVPTRAADNFPVCPECKEAWEAKEDS